MVDGSDAIADWALLNAMLNGAAGADLIALHGLAGRSQSAGVTLIADGSSGAAERIERVLEADTGLGILRYADAGYQAATAAAERNGLGIERQLAARGGGRPGGRRPGGGRPGARAGGDARAAE